LKKTSLKPFNSFGVDAYAKKFVSVNSEKQILDFLDLNKSEKLLILGAGTNILFRNNIQYPVIKIDIKGIEIINEDDKEVLISVGAGENWNELVWWCIDNDFGGIENLVSIPGNVGSAPIQNIGAYGKEIKDVLESCRGVFVENSSIKIFNNHDCNFSYRSSVFKEDLKNKFIITNVTLRLSKIHHKINTEYSSLKQFLKENHINKPTLKNIAECVSKIRSKKLPDYKKTGNAGSFFKNPTIGKSKLKEIGLSFPDLVSYNIGKSKYKISAGWLIEKCGFKKKEEKNVSVYKNQALVIINLGKAKGIDIYNYSQKIKESVRKKFDILLEEEVNII
tara:strand:- start:607 stop:1611 length:1005 start_codon:yes stop_codon:yes gene_type:complete